MSLMMTTLEQIRPVRKDRVFDLAREAGFDVSDWIGSSNDPRGHRANPKYCYNWSFVEPGKVAILNLWYAAMAEEDGAIVHRSNFRADAEAHRVPGGNRQWLQRAVALDEALQVALVENLPVRVTINHGIMRNRADPAANPSKVTARQLDNVPWTITEYGWATGAHVITRGIVTHKFVDQFGLDQAEKSDVQRRARSGTEYVRDPQLRIQVLARAQGTCELCGMPGFRMQSGAVYLETHHIIPLCEGGADQIANVVALCPNDHRRAHYAYDAEAVREQLSAQMQR